MEEYNFILQAVIMVTAPLIIAFLGAILGKYLDGLMDYGSILGGVRFRIARWYARKDFSLLRKLQKASYIEGYHERMEAVNTIYWEIAGRNQAGAAFSWFTGWICIVCFVSRVTCLLFFCSLPLLLKVGAGPLAIFVTFIVSPAYANAIQEKL